MGSPRPIYASAVQRIKQRFLARLTTLKKNGYLICETKSAKRYKSPLKLTEKGLDIGKRIADKIAAVLEEISVESTEAQRLQFYHSLSVISRRLDRIANKGCD